MAVSPQLLPRPTDWPDRVHLTGHWHDDATPAPLDPANVAGLVVYLASDEAQYISGQFLEVGGGKITLWKDYWDMGALANHAPPSWLADFANADMSWVFDATGIV